MTELREEGEIKSIQNEDLFESISFPATNNISSYTSLIRWNISKALKENPRLDLKEALKLAKTKLQKSSSTRFNRQLCPEGYYLSCALLAWQNLGQNNPEQLFEFIIHNTLTRPEYNFSQTDLIENEISPFNKKSSILGSTSFMPLEPTVVMRFENNSKLNCCRKEHRDSENTNRRDNNNSRSSSRNTQIKKTPTGNKNITDEACCKETGCADRLKAMDNTTIGLRKRAEQLAKREAERIELLERAEAAWKDLERGYQRRLKLAEEKEYCMTKQIEKLLEERNEAKEGCTALVLKLKEDGETMQKDRQRLSELEKQVRARGCMRHRIFEESAKGDSGLAEQQIKASQIDRDLQFKEQQAQRTLTSLQNELDCVKMLRYESERAMRLDMADLKQEAQVVSTQLLDQDEKILTLKEELNELKHIKEEISKEVAGRNSNCDATIQNLLDELKIKRDELQVLKDRVLQCRCKVPIDESIQVKRTPSIAALCHCLPDDKIDPACISCSCTSLRSSLMANLLSDLFVGLRSEMGTGLNMPCQLLKCLEDKHNWDLPTSLKTKLVDFFSNLLLNELNIAIATSIEKYHAKWVGATCADAARLLEESQQNDLEMSEAQERMQARAIELRAQELATKLAEELFQQKAEKLAAERAKEIIAAGPPPCECAKKKEQVYSCVLENKPKQNRKNTTGKNNDVMTTYWFKTHKDVSELRSEIDNLKKDSIKKVDLKVMENKITRIVQKAAIMARTIKSTKEEINLSKDNDHSKISAKEMIIKQNNYISKTPFKKINHKKTNQDNNSARPIKHFINIKEPLSLKKVAHYNQYNLSEGNNLDDNKSKSNLLKQVLNPDDDLSYILLNRLKVVNLDKASSNIAIKLKENEEVCNVNDNSLLLNKGIHNKDIITQGIKKNITQNESMNINLKKCNVDINTQNKKSTICINDIKDNSCKLRTLDIVNKNESVIKQFKINRQILSNIRNVALTNVNDFLMNSYPRINNTEKIMQIVNNCKILKVIDNDTINLTSVTNEMNQANCNNINIDIVNNQYPEIENHSLNYRFEKELEQKVYKLLHEYIMTKIKVFQKKCISNCINYNDENYLLSSLVTQVNSVIFENIKTIELSQEALQENYWKQAYLLMQKYIKIKLKRAQTAFNETELYEYTNEQDYGPMLFKVCELIEADFKRITCLCTCEKDDVTK